MAYTLSPYDTTITTMSPHTSTSHTARRFSRSYSSQPNSHPYRVEKPRSNHNSPHTVERRRTTTGAKLYATLDDHYNMMMGLTGDEATMEDVPEPPTTRPVSWHPSSGHFQVPRPAYESNEPVDYSRHYPESCRNSTHGSDFYSMSARNSSYFEPVQSLQNLSAAHESHRGSQDSDNSWPTQAYSQSSFSTPATDPMPWYLQEWARKNQAQAQSQQGSADFLPIQHPTEQEDPAVDEDMEDSGKELVGMGLYDLPDPSDQWGSLQGEATGKGLKLEETWQPPEEEDDDEEEAGEGEGEGDDASSENDEEELPQPPTEHLPVPTDLKPQTPGSMEGQSFFFEEDESIAKEWWYPQLRQPTVPVRDAGIGYGWL